MRTGSGVVCGRIVLFTRQSRSPGQAMVGNKVSMQRSMQRYTGEGRLVGLWAVGGRIGAEWQRYTGDRQVCGRETKQVAIKKRENTRTRNKLECWKLPIDRYSIIEVHFHRRFLYRGLGIGGDKERGG